MLEFLGFRNLRKVFLCCSSSGNSKNALSRVLHGLWSIRERCICWLFSCHITVSIIEFPFHLEKNLNFQQYNNFQDVCRIPRIYLNAKINFITLLSLLFYSSQCVEALCILSTPWENKSKIGQERSSMQQADYHRHRPTPWMQESVSMHKSPTPLRHPRMNQAMSEEEKKRRRETGRTEARRLMERKAAQQNKTHLRN